METYDTRPEFQVEEAEYRRLLGWPRDHVPGARALELAAWARAWYAEHGRPWVYLRRAELAAGGDSLRLDGVEFRSERLHQHLREHRAESAMLLVVSAGRECEEHARQLWNEHRPDEYFFLEVYGSAVVEDLVARASGRVCDLAGHQGLAAVPHYSPGYTGWDVAEQPKLFDLIAHRMSRQFPGPIEVLASGMLRPKKSLLAVVGLTPAAQASPQPAATPCLHCSFTPCQYRRAPYRHVPRESGTGAVTPAAAPEAAAPAYTVSVRALRKWAAERVRLEPRSDGTLEAVFRFDGTTCSNMGRPIAFDYRLMLATAGQGHRIVEAACAPADEGYQFTCAYLGDADGFLRALDADRPPAGRSLDEALGWERAAAPSGCLCTAENRVHKWRLALEAIHFALTQTRVAQPVA